VTGCWPVQNERRGGVVLAVRREPSDPASTNDVKHEHITSCDDAHKRAIAGREVATRNNWVLAMALDNLTLAEWSYTGP